MLFLVEFLLTILLCTFLFAWFAFTVIALAGYLYDEQPENFRQATSVALRGFPKSLILGLVLTLIYPLG